ncbi:hypothetical protein ACHAWF_014655 [Thalassiosira exigua]
MCQLRQGQGGKCQPQSMHHVHDGEVPQWRFPNSTSSLAQEGVQETCG